MPAEDSVDIVTVLLDETRTAESRIGQLLPEVYAQLRQAAAAALARERADHTLQPTALVHEAYMRLVGERRVPWANRAHFYVAAAEAMRRVLLDHARAKGAAKRGGRWSRARLTDVAALAQADRGAIEALDAAVSRLDRDVPEAAQVLRLRFFAGLTLEQTAEALGISPRQVGRLWTYARARLYREMDPSVEDADVANGD